MKIGDVVMFINEGVYARWFYGKIGVVKNYTPVGSDGNSHCRIEWMQPVKYHQSFTKVSDFRADYFEVCQS